jgi:hypothetical protein
VSAENRARSEALSVDGLRTLARIRRIALRVLLGFGAVVALALGIGAASCNLTGTLFMLAPLLFVVPVFGLIVVRGIAYIEKRAAAVEMPTLEDPSFGASQARPIQAAPATGTLELRPEAMRRRNAIFLTLFALVWNAIVGVGALLSGSAFGFITLFLVAGLALLGGAVYMWAQLLNPRPVVTLARGDLALGDEITLQWHLMGRRAELTGFRIRLRGEERASYRRGTDRVTKTHVFHDAPIFETERSALAQRGSATLRIPGDSMHSFTAPDNSVIWHLVVEGDVPRWPDIRDEFEIQVAPRRAQL